MDKVDTVGEVGRQIFDLNFSRLDLVVEPAQSARIHVCARQAIAYHLVKVFSWTLTHCFSSNTIAA